MMKRILFFTVAVMLAFGGVGGVVLANNKPLVSPEGVEFVPLDEIDWYDREGNEIPPPDDIQAQIDAQKDQDGSVVDVGGSGIDLRGLFDSGELAVGTLVVDSLVLPMSVDDNVYPEGAELTGGYYMQVQTSQLGEVLIYVPMDYQYGSFALDQMGNVVNLTASVVSGVLWRGGSVYDVRWSSFYGPTYRERDVSSRYSDLTVTEVLNTNVQIIDCPEDVPLRPVRDDVQLLILCCLGVIVLCLFMKRF